LENTLSISPNVKHEFLYYVWNIAKLTNVLKVSILNIMDYEHEQDKEELKSQLYQLIDEASEKDLVTIYRIVGAIVR